MSEKNLSEIVIRRIYDAPLRKVWDAWMDPKQVGAWWGPRGFTITSHKKDVRVGGTWEYTMHGPDGAHYENKTVFLEVEEHARLVYDHGGNDERPPMFRVNVLFTALGNGDKTQMDMRMILPTPEAAAQTRTFVKAAGGNATWDRLGEYLAETLQGKHRFVINRSFEASVDTLYAMWTEKEHLTKWAPPTGFTMEYIRAELHADGQAFYRMSGPEGATLHGTAHYFELTKPKRVVYTQQFATETGALARHPMAPTWPESMLTVVEFVEEGPQETRVTLTWEPAEGTPRDEVETFCAGRAGMTQGWTGSFDKLEAYLLRSPETIA
jgi:uncharacterized protein YndB with AHSA1/START domain